jgi:hypothetical protein
MLGSMMARSGHFCRPEALSVRETETEYRILDTDLLNTDSLDTDLLNTDLLNTDLLDTESQETQ